MKSFIDHLFTVLKCKVFTRKIYRSVYFIIKYLNTIITKNRNNQLSVAKMMLQIFGIFQKE
jgi:hypothetical protein